jgi:hypothetical protein
LLGWHRNTNNQSTELYRFHWNPGSIGLRK